MGTKICTLSLYCHVETIVTRNFVAFQLHTVWRGEQRDHPGQPPGALLPPREVHPPQVFCPVHGREPDGGRRGREGAEHGGRRRRRKARRHTADQKVDKDAQGHHYAPHQRHHPGKVLA